MIRILTAPPQKIQHSPSTFIAPRQRKQLSRYKLKKQTGIIEQILTDPLLANI